MVRQFYFFPQGSWWVVGYLEGMSLDTLQKQPPILHCVQRQRLERAPYPRTAPPGVPGLELETCDSPLKPPSPRAQVLFPAAT